MRWKVDYGQNGSAERTGRGPRTARAHVGCGALYYHVVDHDGVPAGHQHAGDLSRPSTEVAVSDDVLEDNGTGHGIEVVIRKRDSVVV